nr:MG2 domain-containing protein [Pseudozobellia thermophila]
MLQAQDNGDPYQSLWKKVQELEREDLTKSALELVEGISKKATKEKNAQQAVKALLFVSKYAMTLEEDAQLSIIERFKAEIARADFPTKNILESYLANMYWQYFQQNRYRFYQRSTTETKVDSTDFRTWDLNTLFYGIDLHFKASLANKQGLQKTDLKGFEEILNRQEDSETFRPTLYDLLAHTALQFYKTNETAITRPADKYEIKDPETLCEAYQFIDLDLGTNDKTSLQAKALGVYQELIRFHFDHPKLEPLVMADIERMDFVYQNATFPNKEMYYEETLRNSAERLRHHEVSALYNYSLAEMYHRQGQAFDPETNTAARWKHKEALALCDEVIARFPNSMGAEKCKALKSQILAPSLSIVTERNIPVDRPSKLLVHYKNLNSLKLSAHVVNNAQIKELNELYPQKKQLAFIEQLKSVKSWSARLKNENDYQVHGIEVLLPPLENGQYIILATPEKEGDESFAFGQIQVTNMALVEINAHSEKRYQVIDRMTGEPLSGAKMTFTYLKNYNKPYLTRTERTDKMGLVTIPLTHEHWNYVKVEIDFNGERAFYGDYAINKKQEENTADDVHNQIFLFTDRSIYRPGQPVYFKGILTASSEDRSRVVANGAVRASLHDVNGQKISELEFLSNEFGSFNGEFILPNSGLTGEFHIKTSAFSGKTTYSHYFSVEEYKRPKFETSFKPVSETYKVNDSVTVTGTATAYAGSHISDAKVSYRVKRAVYFPRWYYWHMPPYYTPSSQEIAHGETRTNASGEYDISFKALPDNSVSKENLPTFTYEITADVTDINGETHSTSTFVSVGYHSLVAHITVPDLWDKDRNQDKIQISTTNLNGQETASKGSLKMYKLQAPEQVLRPRVWPAPDYKNWNKEAYKNLFPNEAYEKEDQPANWNKGKLVWQTDFDTEKSKEFNIKNLKNLTSGKYLIELETQDKSGQPVTEKAITTLISENDKQLADNGLFSIKTDKDDYRAGDKVRLTLSSNSEDLTVTVFIDKQQKIVGTHKIHLNRNSKTITLPVTEDDLGGFAVNYTFSAYNSFESGTLPVSVPYPETDLEIETNTFRDKLHPGTGETWSFKIKGPQGERVSAELLASMYDASLDTFRPHYWNFNPLARGNYYTSIYANSHICYGTHSFRTYLKNHPYHPKPQLYDSFNWFGFYFGKGYIYGRGLNKVMKSAAPMMADAMAEGEALEEETVADAILTGTLTAPTTNDTKVDDTDIQIRKNLQETAFFFPELRTDKEGNVSFSFTTPEALTKWKLKLLAHTKTVQNAKRTLYTLTQKELMVMPNAPRFLREGDEITISSKIANLTDKPLSGQAKLVLVDLVSGKDVSDRLLGAGTEYPFSVDAQGNTQVSWRLKIPENLQAVEYTVMAKAGDFSDGEQNALPVLTNRMLVTESLPMWVRSGQTKTFVLEKLKDNTSTTLKNHKLTLEITSNPAWYAVQALPYLMEYPYDCNEQTFARYYANALASHIAHSNEKIKRVFDQWAGSDALIGNLEKNEELKSLLIQETPWLRDAQSEAEQKKRIALLFDFNKMKDEETRALNQLTNNQKPSGAWPWFNGGPDNRYITQHIVAGLGHLKKLRVGSASDQNNTRIAAITQKAIAYLDAEFIEEYETMKRYADNLDHDHLTPTQMHYLYMRSFFKDFEASEEVDEAKRYYLGQAKKYWPKKGLYAKGMLALTLSREGDAVTSRKILRGLKENSIVSDELGMYWKENTASWYWYQAPIETQALLIEAFGEIEDDTETIDNLKIWLLKHKQTNQWPTTKSTSEAVYALLLQGSDWLSVTEAVDVTVGGKNIDPSTMENTKTEAGTGYFKTSWNRSEIQQTMAEATLRKKGKGIAWGALYWQYFEDLDKITTAKTPLQLKKKLFLKKNTDTGEKISELTETTGLKVGDLVRVRIELRSDRDMEFVHMKDMRAAGFEPVNVISRYKWQDGLGYYESTKDASTNFFFDYLPKGVYVFEYDLRVNNAGEFSNGITTIQSMYAPEFSSHSEGLRVKVEG